MRVQETDCILMVEYWADDVVSVKKSLSGNLPPLRRLHWQRREQYEYGAAKLWHLLASEGTAVTSPTQVASRAILQSPPFHNYPRLDGRHRTCASLLSHTYILSPI